jgi:hypothetical protein
MDPLLSYINRCTAHYSSVLFWIWLCLDQIKVIARAHPSFPHYISIPHFGGYFVQQLSLFINLDTKWVGLHFGRIFHKLIWSPWLGPLKMWWALAHTKNIHFEHSIKRSFQRTSIKSFETVQFFALITEQANLNLNAFAGVSSWNNTTYHTKNRVRWVHPSLRD